MLRDNAIYLIYGCDKGGDSMSGTIRELCVMSVLFGMVLSVTPEGGIKTVMGILCSVILITVLIRPVVGIDMKAYALELSKYRQLEAQLETRGEEMRRTLDSMVIQKECEAYIMDKAKELNVQIYNVNVELEWNPEGIWVPCFAEIFLYSDLENTEVLSDVISTEIGIAKEGQMWSLIE